MTTGFRTVFAVTSALAFMLAPAVANAQQAAAETNTVAISTVLAAAAKRSGKKFIVDPRVTGEVLLLQNNLAAMTYDDFLMVMQIHGFAVVTNGNYVRVVPEAGVRQLALPKADDDAHPLAEYVTKVLSVKNIPAAMLVPVLRPLIPQQGHLVAIPCTNDLIIVDTFGNVQRLEKIIRSLDHGEPHTPAKCSALPLAGPAAALSG
jgi:type II secretory pathway component GspD/PulD (secretin)